MNDFLPTDRPAMRRQALRNRERAARARRVALCLPRESARRNLETIAGQIEAEAQELERRVAGGPDLSARA